MGSKVLGKLIKIVRNPEELGVRWLLWRQARHKSQVKKLAPLSESRLQSILRDELGLRQGDTVCVHSALGFLNLQVDPAQTLRVLREVVGAEGTLVFPSYPGASNEFLAAGKVFDVRSTSSAKATGLLTDLAWREPGAIRSLHPTKSMSACGPMATRITADHHRSPFPYDRTSPYFRLSEVGAKIIGLGVWTYNLSFVHCIEDTMKQNFPFCPHLSQLFRATVIDASGAERIVPSFAHDLKRISYDTLLVQDYMRRHVAREIAHDMTIEGRRFFRVEAAPLYQRMCELAESGITIFAHAQKKSGRERESERWREVLAAEANRA